MKEPATLSGLLVSCCSRCLSNHHYVTPVDHEANIALMVHTIDNRIPCQKSALRTVATVATIPIDKRFHTLRRSQCVCMCSCGELRLLQHGGHSDCRSVPQRHSSNTTTSCTIHDTGAPLHRILQAGGLCRGQTRIPSGSPEVLHGLGDGVTVEAHGDALCRPVVDGDVKVHLLCHLKPGASTRG